MKKTLALVLALAMVFSTITVAFAEGTLSADAQICADLGMLKGPNGTVDAAYTASTPSRLQAAIMFLRLKGLEAEALAFTGEANFADGNIAWAEGANLLAYLKANPQLGWQGDGTNFNPEGAMTAQAYYKVMLEALGYKQTTPEVVGDFAYADTLTFAASKGLTKVAAVTNFTINDLATATVEALKANMKEGGKTLVATLVEAGKVDKAKAVAAQLYVDAAATTDAALKAVKAIGNTRVEVEFTADVEKAFAENVANYAVVEKGTTTALEVSAAVLDGTKKVVLETAAQSSGKAYTLTVGEVAMNFGGVAKNTGAPELDKVEGTDTERVELTFTKVMDLASALDVNNYKIDGVTIVSAAWADSSRKIVELTTEGLVANKTYKVTVTNVASVDLVNLKSASKNFLAKSDKTAPTPNVNKTSSTNTRIIVYFNEEVTAESAENLANYSLTVGSTENALEILSAKLVEDKNDLNQNKDDGDKAVVELTTAPQKSGQKYVLHINNIADTSVLANVMTKEKKIDYYGVRVDTTKPTVSKIDYLTNSLIQIDFSETSRLDNATVLDLNNYSVNNDVVIEKVELVDADDADCKSVRLTVSELGEKSSYQIVIKDIADEYGNVMAEKKFTRTFNKAYVNTPATVDKVVSSGLNTVKVYFTKLVETASAKDVANYTINNEVGTPIKASLSDDSKFVTLTTEELTANKEYKITINGVEDLAGNVITDIEVKFVVSATENDIDAPEIDDITTVNDMVVRVTFNEAIDVTAAPVIYIDWSGADMNAGAYGDITATYAVATDDDDMVLEFTIPTANRFTLEEDVKLVSTTAKDLAGNVCADKDVIFSSLADDPENPELLSWEQTSVKEFTLIYSEKIVVPAAPNNVINTNTTDGSKVPYKLTVTSDKDDKTIVYLTADQKMDTEKVFQLNLADFDFGGANTFGLKNAHGIAVGQDDNNRTVIETTFEDEDAPYIENVVATANDKIVVTFNEEIGSLGSWKISYINDDGEEDTISTGLSYAKTDDAELTITLTNKKLEAKYIYTLKVGTSRLQDVAYNKIAEDATFDFAGTNVVGVGNYITGVKLLNGTTLELTTNIALDPNDVVFDVVYGTNDSEVLAVTETPVDVTDGVTKVYKLPANGDYAFASGTTYKVRIKDNADPTKVLYSYTFDGIVESGAVVEKVSGNYQVTFTDAKDGDTVVIVNEITGVTQTATVNSDGVAVFNTAADYADGGVFDKTAAAGYVAATNVTVMCMRGTVVLYYDFMVELPQ